MRRVEQYGGLAPQHFQPGGEERVPDPLCHVLARNAEPAPRRQVLERAHGRDGVVDLVPPRQRHAQAQSVVFNERSVYIGAQYFQLVVVRQIEGAAPFFGGPGDDAGGLRKLERIADHRRPGLDDAALFKRNLLEGSAEVLHVVERNFREHGAHRRGDDVGRVKPAAESRFQGDNVAALGVIVEHGGGGHEFKLGHRVVHLLDMRLEYIDRPGQVFIGNTDPVNGNALVEIEHKG